jgi:hypothetical protein
MHTTSPVRRAPRAVTCNDQRRLGDASNPRWPRVARKLLCRALQRQIATQVMFVRHVDGAIGGYQIDRQLLFFDVNHDRRPGDPPCVHTPLGARLAWSASAHEVERPCQCGGVGRAQIRRGHRSTACATGLSPACAGCAVCQAAAGQETATARTPPTPRPEYRKIQRPFPDSPGCRGKITTCCY